MRNMNIDEIAEAWIEMWSYEVNNPERDKFDWVYDFEDEATHDQPEIALKLILAVLEKNQTNHILEVLSAGPLEDLLAYHGEHIIEIIEAEARKNKQFAGLLGGVWQNSMLDHIWERVQKVWDRSGWDGND
ncbi:MAG: hypothetical protein GC149_07420 [Gammaproteobacteria bacterium]|nr:hypothetical protein [Gammaproteobacteria bacterium]